MSAALRVRTEMLIEQDRQATAAASRPMKLSEGRSGTELYELLTGQAEANVAGIPVTERSAMLVSAVFASVGLIGGSIAAIPFHLYKRQPEGDGRDRYDSPLWWLFNESPWPSWTAASAWSFVGQSIGLKGDAFWRIHRGVGVRMAEIRGFEPLHPDDVFVQRVSGRNVYTYVDEQGAIQTVDQDDMLHFPGLGYNGLRSITPIQASLRAPVGIALAADSYAGAFFRNGARPDFALATEGKLGDDQVKLLRQTWEQRHQGPSNAHLPAILTGGLKVQQLTLSAEDAQLLLTRKFQVEDIARIFGVPPHMIGAGDKPAALRNLEELARSYVKFTLRRYLDAIQQEINRKVWPRSLRVFGEFNADALMDGDSTAQAGYFSKALGGPGSQGWMTINEVRRLKNLKPIEGGDALIFAGRDTGASNAPLHETDRTES